VALCALQDERVGAAAAVDWRVHIRRGAWLSGGGSGGGGGLLWCCGRAGPTGLSHLSLSDGCHELAPLEAPTPTSAAVVCVDAHPSGHFLALGLRDNSLGLVAPVARRPTVVAAWVPPEPEAEAEAEEAEAAEPPAAPPAAHPAAHPAAPPAAPPAAHPMAQPADADPDEAAELSLLRRVSANRHAQASSSKENAPKQSTDQSSKQSASKQSGSKQTGHSEESARGSHAPAAVDGRGSAPPPPNPKRQKQASLSSFFRPT
jgi:hypothetical protein